MTRKFIADYESPCGLCEKGIEPGDEAVYVDDEPCHAQCARDEGIEVE